MSETNLYAGLGVDASKKEVRAVFHSVIDNDFPMAFVNIVRDPSVPGTVVTQHGDGDGSKSLQRILCYLETQNEAVLAGAVDDGVAMNMGDIAASGFLHGFTTWTDNLNIGNMSDFLPKKTIMAVFAKRFAELRDLHRQHGFQVKFLGGETADLPDQVRTSVFDMTVNAREAEENIIRGNVQPGDVIYGFASDGQATWEDAPNSGIMSNGLTLAGTCLGWKGYFEKHPFLRLRNPYVGKYKIGETDPLLGENMTVFDALLSPTRQWAILIRWLVDELKKHNLFHMLHGISLNTGGGATKIGHVGKNILYTKSTMPDPPPTFQLIQREGKVSWEEMFQSFNCGVGIDVVGEDHPRFDAVLRRVSKRSGIALYRLGRTESNGTAGNRVVLGTPYGLFNNY